MIFRRYRRTGTLLLGLGMCALVTPQLAAASVEPVTAETTRSMDRDAVPPGESISVHRWTGPRDFTSGSFRGTRPAESARALTIAHPAGTRTYTDPYGGGTQRWDYARWTSPMHRVGFGATELVASWTADAPQGTWLQVQMRGVTTDGERTQWYVMGRWAELDVDIHRTTVSGQNDEHGRIVIDTFKAADNVALRSYQLRVTLYQLPGSDASPVVRSVSAMASRIPGDQSVETSPPGGAAGTVLDVPQYSQNTHLGHYSQWDGGGEAWCSPTSTAMVLSYWGRGPTEQQMSWIPDGHNDPQVDFAARGTYDYNYEGTGTGRSTSPMRDVSGSKDS